MNSISKIIFIMLVFGLFLFIPNKSHALYDPLTRANNFFGIHILFPDELDRARTLVNSNGGDWGYVTIPIQSGDRDIEKWQKFMDKSYEMHLIPILRLATEADPRVKGVWRKPQNYDIVDFANFMSSLNWPTENKYVIIFNEINRSDEWGGEKPDPKYYSDLLDYSIDTFKSRNNDFFIIMGGLDVAAPNDGYKFMDGFDFLSQMQIYKPELFKKIDGFASHSYPNPNFSAPPNSSARVSVSTYKYEYEFINKNSDKKKPVFITETGWNRDTLSEDKISDYFKYSLDNIWGPDKDKIVAITPFLLESQNGQFDKFSFYKDGSPTAYCKTFQSYSKTKGDPYLIPRVKKIVPSPKVLGVMDFKPQYQKSDEVNEILKLYIKRIFAI